MVKKIYIIDCKSNLTLFVNIKIATLNDPKNTARDIYNIGH
jgi:predicted transport protein